MKDILDDLAAAIAYRSQQRDGLGADVTRVLAERDAACAERDAAIARVAERDAALSMAEQNLAIFRDMVDLRDATITEHRATIAAKDAEIARLEQENADYHQVAEEQIAEIHAQRAELARLKALLPPFIFADATRQQWLGLPDSLPISYESEFYPSGVTQAQRPTTPISRDFVRTTTMPRWRTSYPNAPRWCADIEWQWSDNVFTADEVQRILPAFQGARDFADTERKGLRLGGYGFTHRFGNSTDLARVREQIEVYRPILDLLDEVHLTLYAIYFDIEASRRYIVRNIEMARESMPGKPVICLLWPAWHGNVKGTHPELPGTPISVEWWRMALETCHEHADGLAIWTKAAAPQPTNEPWWLETQAFRNAL